MVAATINASPGRAPAAAGPGRSRTRAHWPQPSTSHRCAALTMSGGTMLRRHATPPRRTHEHPHRPLCGPACSCLYMCVYIRNGCRGSMPGSDEVIRKPQGRWMGPRQGEGKPPHPRQAGQPLHRGGAPSEEGPPERHPERHLSASRMEMAPALAGPPSHGPLPLQGPRAHAGAAPRANHRSSRAKGA